MVQTNSGAEFRGGAWPAYKSGGLPGGGGFPAAAWKGREGKSGGEGECVRGKDPLQGQKEDGGSREKREDVSWPECGERKLEAGLRSRRTECRFAFVLVCGTGEALRGAEPMGQGQDVPQSSHWLLPGRELQEQGRRPGGWQQAGEVTVAAGVGKALVVALRH